MTIFDAVILSIIEGLTEFLPISSTGHLVLTAKILNLPQTNFVKSFEIFIQLGAILAVTFIIGATVWRKREVFLKIIAAFMPTALLGYISYPLIKGVLLGNTIITAAALFLGGIVLLVLEKLRVKNLKEITKIEQLNYKQAITIGFFQSISMIPGVSRAAATIIGGILAGLSRKTAVEFSFILAIPTMMAATFFDIYKEKFQFNPDEVKLLLIGITLSFIWAALGVKFLLKFTEKHSFAAFGVYRIIIAILFFIFFIYK